MVRSFCWCTVIIVIIVTTVIEGKGSGVFAKKQRDSPRLAIGA
jgi:hypothetical protein